MATATKDASISIQPRLREEYKTRIAGELQKELGLANPHQIPKLEKIVINIEIGRAHV